MNENLFPVALLIAAIAEAFIQNVKPIYSKDVGFNADILLSLIVAVVLCLAYGVDFLASLGLTSAVPYVGEFITGVLLGRGASFVHDIYKLTRTKSIL